MIAMKINWDTIIEYFKLRYDKQLSKKDLFNIAGSKKSQKELYYDEKVANEMKSFIEDFIEKQRNSENNSSTELDVDKCIEQIHQNSLAPAQIETNNIDDIIEYVHVEVDDTTIDFIQDSELNDDSTHFKFIEKNELELIIEDSSEEMGDEFRMDVNYLVKNDILDEGDIIFESQINESFQNEINSDLRTISYEEGRADENTEVFSVIEVEKPKPPFHRKRKLSTLDREILKVRRRVSNCRNCGTDIRLVKQQLELLLAMKSKLKIETKVLTLQKKKLELEIKKLENK